MTLLPISVGNNSRSDLGCLPKGHGLYLLMPKSYLTYDFLRGIVFQLDSAEG